MLQVYIDYGKAMFGRLGEENEEGQGLVEYALILVLIAVVVIAAVRVIGTNANTTFETIGGALGT